MKYVAAYMLLALGGKEAPSSAEIKALLEKGGVEVDDEKLASFAKSVEGKEASAMLAEGKEKVKSLAAAGGGGGGSGAAAGGDAAAEEAPKEEEEPAEEVDVGGGGLFGGEEEGY